MSDRTWPAGVDPELLDRYLSGQGTEAENALVRRYLMTRPDIARELEEFLRELDGEAGRPASPDPRSSLASLKGRIAKSDDAEPKIPPGRRRSPLFTMLPRKTPPKWLKMTRVALATAAGLVAVAFGVYGVTRSSQPVVEPVEWRNYATNNAERAELRLIDGTRIRLAPASRLRVGSDFGDVRREVYLEGEAYFDVTHDDARPFVVHAGNTRAEDLGTAFSVRSYATDPGVQVVVREGAVDLHGVGRLEPGDLGALALNGETLLRRGVNVDSLLGWLDGRLTFDDAPLAEVLRSIRRWYDLDVHLSDSSLANVPFTGELDNTTAHAAVRMVAATLGLRVSSAGTAVRLSPTPGITPRRTQGIR